MCRGSRHLLRAGYFYFPLLSRGGGRALIVGSNAGPARGLAAGAGDGLMSCAGPHHLVRDKLLAISCVHTSPGLRNPSLECRECRGPPPGTTPFWVPGSGLVPSLAKSRGSVSSF